MGEDNRDDLVVDVADALTLDQRVQWDRCARLATPANRQVLDNLRAFSTVLAGRRAAGDASPTWATGSEPFAGAFVRRAVYAIAAFAAVEVAATLMLALWGWDDVHREYGELAVFLATLVVAHVATACLFLLAGRHDQRTWLLGLYFLLKATLVNPFALLALLRGLPPTEPFGYPNFGHPYVYPFMFAPAVLWAFARECPRVHRRTWLDDLARRMVRVSLLIGCVTWVGGVAWFELARTGYLDPAVFWVGFDGLLATLNLLALAAVVVVVLRAHTAPADEARRVALFSIAFLMYVGLSTTYDVVETLSPGDWLSNFRWSPAVAVVELLRFPGIVLLWYSVLTVRVPHLREVIRAFYRRLLRRGRLLGLLAAAPAVPLGWLVASRPERAVGAVLTDPWVQSLAAVAGIMLLVVVGREQILLRLDAWIFRETTDQRQAVARAATALAKVGQVTAVSCTVSKTARRGCGSPAALLVATETNADEFGAPDGRMAPLARGSAIVQMLEMAGGSLRVHPSDAASFFALLPPDEAAWVAETDADAIVPVPGPGAELSGVVVVGRRLDGRVVRSIDIPFLEALGAAAGLAVARLRLMHDPGAKSPEAPAAYECPACRCVTAAGEQPACDCGSTYMEADVPTLLAGKYRLARRLGRGGMGAVYLARDLRLERDVAVKTLTGMSLARLTGLKPEAWAMATVSHPGVAQVYGIESWRGRPFLIVELLPGGTLADRLRRGPVPPAQAVAVTTTLAGALATLHEAGYLHGDVKPSNVGLTSNGSPKLLDFGLARAANDADSRGGTLRYLSPEVLSGRPADEADDVWSLCVLLHEMVAGEHPFAGGGIAEVTDRIRRQRLGRGARPAAGSGSPAAVTAFTASMLTAVRSARPASAHAFAAALKGALDSA